MAAILGDKLKDKVARLQDYVQQKLLSITTCSAELRARAIKEINGRVESETKVLLHNAISVLSQECISKHSGDSDWLGRYFDSSIEKDVREKFKLNFDFNRQANRQDCYRTIDVKAAGVGVLGAATGAFIARRFALAWLSPQVAAVALLSAAFCYLGTRVLLVKDENRKWEVYSKKVAEEFGLKVSEWLAKIEDEFIIRVSKI